MNDLVQFKEDRLQLLADEINGAVQDADHTVSVIGIALMWKVGHMILLAAQDLNQPAGTTSATVAPRLEVSRGRRWLEYSIKTAKKYPSQEALPLKGVRQFIREELTEEKTNKVEIIGCKHRCSIHQ